MNPETSYPKIQDSTLSKSNTESGLLDSDTSYRNELPSDLKHQITGSSIGISSIGLKQSELNNSSSGAGFRRPLAPEEKKKRSFEGSIFLRNRTESQEIIEEVEEEEDKGLADYLKTKEDFKDLMQKMRQRMSVNKKDYDGLLKEIEIIETCAYGNVEKRKIVIYGENASILANKIIRFEEKKEEVNIDFIPEGVVSCWKIEENEEENTVFLKNEEFSLENIEGIRGKLEEIKGDNEEILLRLPFSGLKHIELLVNSKVDSIEIIKERIFREFTKIVFIIDYEKYQENHDFLSKLGKSYEKLKIPLIIVLLNSPKDANIEEIKGNFEDIYCLDLENQQNFKKFVKKGLKTLNFYDRKLIILESLSQIFAQFNEKLDAKRLRFENKFEITQKILEIEEFYLKDKEFNEFFIILSKKIDFECRFPEISKELQTIFNKNLKGFEEAKDLLVNFVKSCLNSSLDLKIEEFFQYLLEKFEVQTNRPSFELIVKIQNFKIEANQQKLNHNKALTEKIYGFFFGCLQRRKVVAPMDLFIGEIGQRASEIRQEVLIKIREEMEKCVERVKNEGKDEEVGEIKRGMMELYEKIEK